MNTNLNELMDIIGYKFKDISLLENALTHSSYANEKKQLKIKDNERLEFLGDAVLELSSSDYIFKKFTMNEGKMTRLRASIVCEPTLALCAREFGFEEFIKLGKGEELTGGRRRDSIVSDALEALIGAIYLDSDFANAKEFVLKFILNDLDNKQLFFDSKTILQEVVQGMGKEVSYSLIREEGPEHNKTFVVEVKVEGLIEIEGSGHNKKNAQANAAYKALVELKNKGIEIKDVLK
ncbi:MULTISPECIES: ribonuclease III [Lachnospira]|jgi:ribonuclease-3|uniref:Ribonuclease 3 n=1 Tax=Lachnospira pectinoschiza TaxID=28052 RepID=A0A1G9VK81_9FIRM|nr:MULTISPECIES: ribonuclease III [Lachnospira]SDM72668.1 ribonuclease-3 [Lachnospira pectinoschiza]